MNSRGQMDGRREYDVEKKEEMILKATKEIVVKFIETGRVYPSSFEENYRMVERVVRGCVRDEDAE